ncbi:MAG TPA: cofactor-independent phosphoglycerate mutase [Candidatus Omnitrophota bacterium]|nr:cofactor-independent phosphoglycerate mutase [Candidatus Omnitrophota bacterium]
MKDLFEGNAGVSAGMKFIVLVPDGAPDQTYEELQGKTPLEVSRIPNLDALAQAGCVGLAKTVPDSLGSEGEVGKLSVLGYNPKECYTGRAPLEAASLGIELGADEVAFCMNFVTESDGRLVDYTAGHISSEEGGVLIKYLSQKLGSDSVRFYPGVGCKNIAVIKDRMGLRGLSASCPSPSQILGNKLESSWPKGPGDELLRKLMLDGKKLLAAHEINQVRLDLGENPANMIWFWGQGVTPQMQTFRERTGLKGGVVSAADLLRGIANLAGLQIIDVPGITGKIDTNYEGKIHYGLESLRTHHFIFIHVDAMTDAAREGNLKAKIQALEDFDRIVVGETRHYLEKNPDTRVLVLPSCASSCRLKGYLKGAVPFILCGRGISSNGIEHYNEVQAQVSDLRFDEGFKAIDYLLKNG